ncbi:zinc finger protein 219-like [Varroa jacobsoni]|nr:zinc finger protein 219-like [Varroa jacobsoni]
MFLHTGEVPYKCDLCSYGARQKFHLDRHRQKAHGMAPTPKRGRFPGRPSSELSILPVGPPSASPPNGSGNGASLNPTTLNGHSSDPELLTPFPPVFPPMLDPAALKLASNLFQLISSSNGGGSGSSAAGGNNSSASTGSDHSSQDNDV